MKRFALAQTLLAALVSSLALGACSDDGAATTPDLAVAKDGGADAAPAPALLAPKELLDACVRASACKIKQYPSISDCLSAYYELYVDRGQTLIYDKIFRCVNEATDCDGIAACYGRRQTCDKSTAGTCEGDVAVSCDLLDNRIYTLNCADANLSCRTRVGGDAVCVAGDCAAGFETKCVDGVQQTCGGNTIEIEDCASRGLLCGKVWYLEPQCRGETEIKCTEEFKPRCEGNKAVSCVAFREHVEDCSKRTYRETQCVNGACKAKGTGCTLGEVNRCKGDKLEACLDGEWLEIDCGAMGLGVCKVNSATGGGQGAKGANCTPPKTTN
ncbi:MAG: hypothetical protein CSA24_00140 [Deltaproteobacteria bacterium]|nr:MAG: hypothetical protein CSB49_01730 [Pseudomonadota bacterium]PIE66427.1 MAG: hypothetical protein CSA24_00140 [Deltaproteobacteria bacterium]